MRGYCTEDILYELNSFLFFIRSVRVYGYVPLTELTFLIATVGDIGDTASATTTTTTCYPFPSLPFPPRTTGTRS